MAVLTFCQVVLQIELRLSGLLESKNVRSQFQDLLSSSVLSSNTLLFLLPDVTAGFRNGVQVSWAVLLAGGQWSLVLQVVPTAAHPAMPAGRLLSGAGVFPMFSRVACVSICYSGATEVAACFPGTVFPLCAQMCRGPRFPLQEEVWRAERFSGFRPEFPGGVQGLLAEPQLVSQGARERHPWNTEGYRVSLALCIKHTDFPECQGVASLETA